MNTLINQNKIYGKNFYLTKQGLEKIKKEYGDLVQFKLAKTKNDAPKFLHSDDLDPEYLDFENDISLLDARLGDLKYIIENAKTISLPQKSKQNIVQVGARVLVEIDGKEKDEFKIVGTLEANPSLGFISNESPVGRALLGHKIGDEIPLSSPLRSIYKITRIKYSES